MKPGRFVAAFIVIAALPAGAQAATFCVNTSAGLASAMHTAASNGQTDLIQIVQGSYTVTGTGFSQRFLHSGDESVRIEGGYTAGCGSRTVNPANTVLHGIAGEAGLELFSNIGGVSHSVDGVTVTDGQNTSTTTSNGGGLWSWNPGGTFVVTNCVITNNTASQDGGGVYMGEQASATLINNTITGNTSGFGAGVYSYRVTNLTLQGNTISNNTANSVSPPADGGGLYVDASDTATHYILTLTSNTMVSNHSTQGGGAVQVYTSPSGTQTDFTIVGNTFTANSSNSGGAVTMGGVFNFRAERNTFDSNTAALNGAGLAVFTVDKVTIASNLFRNNMATQNGGGVYFIETPLSPPRATFNVVNVANNTFVGNGAGASSFGGGLWARLQDDTDVLNVYNNIFSGNTAGGGAAADMAIDADGNGNSVYSPVNMQDNDFNQSGTGFFITNPGFSIPGSNLSSVNPLFVNPGAGNYRLQSGSPCRNNGNNGAPGLPGYDRDAAFRLAETTVDMGAYEFGAIPFHKRHIVDFDADLRADIATYHSASALWFSRSWYTGATTSASYGGPGYTPVPGDYDGDGKTDRAVYHAASGFWFIHYTSTNSDFSLAFGGTGYLPVADDYDGDGITDIAVYHPASGTWFVRESTGPTLTVGWGGSGYTAVPEDYDGDGKTDIAVYHPASGLWYIRQSSDLSTVTVGYGGSGYVPVPRDYDGDGKADLAVFHTASALWFIRQSMNLATLTVGYGASSYTPVPGYYDPDGRADITVYDPSSGLWFVRQTQSAGSTFSVGFGGSGYDPLR